MQTYHVRVSQASRNNLEESKRQTGKSFVRLIDDALGVDEYTIVDATIDEWVREGKFTLPPKVRPTHSHSSLLKPCSTIIDAQILMCWRYESLRLSKPKKTAVHLGRITLTRKKLIRAVRQKIRLGYYPVKSKTPVQSDSKYRTWGEVYLEWFKHHRKNRSEFCIYFDNRLTALVKQGFLFRTEPGLYKLSSLYPLRRYRNEWAVIEGVTLLPPQKELNIPNILNSRSAEKLY